MKRVGQALATLVVALIVTSANAASLSFVYTGDNDVDSDGTVVAAVNDLLTFDIVMDFTDDPTIGGGYSVSFTAEALRFEAWEVVVLGDPSFNRGPEVLDGLLFSAGFGSLDGLTGPATVARVSFTFLGGAVATLQLEEGTDTPFVSTDFLTQVIPDYGSATIRTPLPGAAWCLLSAMGALRILRRR